jgi:ATP-dependent DNA helicase RecG
MELIIQSICVFASDIENVGRGYIIAGLESENSIPKFPFKRIKHTDINKINQDLRIKFNLMNCVTFLLRKSLNTWRFL